MVSVDLAGRVLGFATTVPVVDGIDVIVNVDDIPTVVDGTLAGRGLGILSCTIKKECWLLSVLELLNVATGKIGSSSKLLLKGGVGQGESAVILYADGTGLDIMDLSLFSDDSHT